MKIVCKQNTAKNLDLKEVTDIFSHDFRYELTIGREYLVMGMALYKDSNCLYYLLDHGGWPDWYPYMLFDVIDNRLSPDWYTIVYDKNGNGDVSMVIGFDELCNDDDFYELLMDGDEEAMRTYFERKKETEADYFVVR